MNAIQIPAKPTYGTSIGDFVFKSLLIFALASLYTVASFAQNDCTMSWLPEVNVNISAFSPYNCETTIRPDNILINPDDCIGVKTVTILDPNDPSATPIDVNPDKARPQLDETHIGKRLKAIVEHMETGEKAITFITLIDESAPEFDCIDGKSDVTINCLKDIKPVSEGGDVEDLGVNDCSMLESLTYADITTAYDCNIEEGVNYVASIARTWTAVDVFGNSSSCVQTIYIARVGIASGPISEPADVDIKCSADVSQRLPENTGYPQLTVGMEVFDLIPNDVGYCDLHIHYADFENDFNFCPGTFQIIRTWTIRDLCYPEEEGVNPRSFVQKINIIDEDGPIVTGVDDMIVGTNNNDCSATVSFPPAVAMDSCSDATVTIETAFGNIDANGGSLNNIPVGVHTIIYKAVDACGNVTPKEIELTVKDDDAPNVVCDQFTVVPLGVNGTAQVQAISFDDGSTDNCGIDSYQVARMATDCSPESEFDDFVDFTCCDLDGPVMVALKVIDAAGNFNICMIEVTVQDKTAPLMTCPPNKDIDCSDDYTNTAFTGTPEVSDNADNCSDVTVRYEDELDLNNCGWGTVTRKWIAEDASGQVTECYQIITIANQAPFTENDIDKPDDYTATDCGAEIHPDSLPYPYGRPVLNVDDCDNVKSYYIDQAIGDELGSACYTIQRTWTIIDLCVYDANEPESPGKWLHVQNIHINDNTDPVFIKGHEDEEIEVSGDCRDIEYTIMADVDDCSPNLTYFYQIDLGNDGSVDSAGMAQMMTLAFFTEGTHKITWRVTDGCGNEAIDDQLITFKDTKAPSVIVEAIFVTLMPVNGGMIEVDAEQFNQSSSDNCTPINWLRYSYSEDVNDTSRMFTCADLGQNNVNIYVHDAEGNFAFAETFVDIQDNNDICPDMMPRVFGAINTPSGKAISNVAVKLEGSAMESLMTDDRGTYEIQSLPQGDFILKPSKDVEVMNGVSTYDMVLMQRHILGLSEIADPYTMIAADVNNNGTVSITDMVAMRKLILNVNTDFANTPSWRFVVAEHDFNSTSGASFPEEYSLSNPSSDMEIDFIGIKIGDINANATTTDLLGGDEIEGAPLAFNVLDQEIKAGDNYSIEFRAKDFEDVIGFQYTLEFDPSVMTIEGFESGSIGLTNDNHNMNEVAFGLVATNWFTALPMTVNDDDVLFTLNVTAIEDIQLSESLQIGSSKTTAEAYRQASLSAPLETGSAEINFIQPEIEVNGFELIQNEPNPFSNSTIIKVNIPSDIDGQLTVYNVAGKAIKVWNQRFEKGQHQIAIDIQDLPDAGVYYYQFATAKYAETKKMIFIK